MVINGHHGQHSHYALLATNTNTKQINTNRNTRKKYKAEIYKSKKYKVKKQRSGMCSSNGHVPQLSWLRPVRQPQSETAREKANINTFDAAAETDRDWHSKKRYKHL